MLTLFLHISYPKHIMAFAMGSKSSLLRGQRLNAAPCARPQARRSVMTYASSRVDK